MKPLAVFGASGHAKVVIDAALLSGWPSVAVFDDAWPALAAVGPWPVVGRFDRLRQDAAAYGGVVIAIGDNATRLARLNDLAGAPPPALLRHPASVVSPFARIGAGSVVCAGAVVGPFARLGAGCIINTGASVDHDCELGDGVHVSPGARLGGGVRVGSLTWIGIGSSIRHGASIGARVIVGAGAAVVSDIADGLTVVGVPARPIRC